MRKRMWLGIFLLLAGAASFLYPELRQLRQEAEQRQMLESLADMAAEEVPGGGVADKPADRPEPSGPGSAEEAKPDRSAPRQPDIPQPQPLPLKPKAYKEGEAIGTIEIPRIDAKLPIVEGISEKSLEAAVGHFPGTAMPGQTGNASFAGHRSYRHGKMFNRLDELEKGDMIILTQDGQTHTYKVTEMFVVEPTEVSVLKQPREGKYLTLVTCTPIRVATHRLIVKAEAAG